MPKPIRREWAVVLALCTLSLWGCATNRATIGPEPPSIALRNATPSHFQSMSVVEVRRRETDPARMGQIAPLGPGAMIVLDRPPDAPPLPLKASVRWVDAAGVERAREVTLDDPLRKATGAPDEVLVFEVLPGPSARAFVIRDATRLARP
jgi:hypothetical protein